MDKYYYTDKEELDAIRQECFTLRAEKLKLEQEIEKLTKELSKLKSFKKRGKENEETRTN